VAARYGRRVPHQPILPSYLREQNPPAVPTPNYIGTVVLANRKGWETRFRSARPKLLFPGPIVAPPPPPVSVPRYMGLVVKAAPGARAKLRLRNHTSKMRLVPAGGFVGAKLGYLTIQPTRQNRHFTVSPTRQATLTVQ
jgi:hypothetical protein